MALNCGSNTIEVVNEADLECLWNSVGSESNVDVVDFETLLQDFEEFRHSQENTTPPEKKCDSNVASTVVNEEAKPVKPAKSVKHRYGIPRLTRFSIARIFEVVQENLHSTVLY